MASLSGEVFVSALNRTQAGVPMCQVVGYMGLTVAEFERTFAHHHPDYMRAETDAIGDALDFKI